MDIPVTIFLVLLAAGCFIAGAALLIKSEGRTGHVILAALWIGAAAVIAYGLDTQCPHLPVYVYCGGE
jgi:peptidoglycan/LPS O-acetylase OafA/YrhL